MRTDSLAFRLIATSAGWSVAVLAITGILLSGLFREAVERNFDARLQVYLDGLIANTELSRQGKLVEAGNLGEIRFNLPFSGWYWQVSLTEDKQADRLASLSLLDQRLTLPEMKQKPTADNLFRSYLGGPENQRLRLIAHQIKLVGSEDNYTFAVAGNSEEMETEIAAFNKTLFIALSLVAMGLALAAFFQVRFGLAPLRSFQRRLAEIRAGARERLSERYPLELQPLANELNALLHTNQEIIERARTHVGNLAHALKTPLSVIMNEAQASKTKFAKTVAAQAQTMRDQVNLYLDRARMAARSRAIGTVVEIGPVIGGIARTLERIHTDRDLTAVLGGDMAAKFRGEKQDFEEIMGNLLDNAFKWAKSTVTITASLNTNLATGAGQEGRAIAIMVDDDGPGLPAKRRADALKRGKRLDETKPGSGLGLSIVAELAALYGGEVRLDDAPKGGLRVVLTLPAA